MTDREVTNELAARWRSAGINDGDLVLVHSSISRTIREFAGRGVSVDPETMLDSLISAVGDKGTLLLPLFNFGFTTGEPFDIRSSPSQMGALTEAARLRTNAVRTGHPIYSFAAIGANSHWFEGRENFSGYGGDSPFADLRDKGGKIAVIDLPDQNSMTFYHYVEEQQNVPYRHHKVFRGSYISFDGRPRLREFGLFVRDLEMGVRTHVNPMGEILWSTGLYVGDRPGVGSGMRTILARDLFDSVTKVIKNGRARGLLYELQ